MKKQWLFGLLVAILAFGLVIGCSNDSTNDGGDLVDNRPPLEPNEIETMTYTGVDSLGKAVEVVILKTASPRAFQIISGDSYYIKYDGTEVSRGVVVIQGSQIEFRPSSGDYFLGTLVGNNLSIPSIPYSGGVIKGFAQAPGVGGTTTGPGVTNVNTYVIGGFGSGGAASQYNDNISVDTTKATTSIKFKFDNPVALNWKDIFVSGSAAFPMANGLLQPDNEAAGFVATRDYVLTLPADGALWSDGTSYTSVNGKVFIQIVKAGIDATPKSLVIYSGKYATVKYTFAKVGY